MIKTPSLESYQIRDLSWIPIVIKTMISGLKGHEESLTFKSPLIKKS